MAVLATTAWLTGVTAARADSSVLGFIRLTLSLPGRMNSVNKPQGPHRLGWLPWICNLLSYFFLCKPYSCLMNNAGHVIPWIPVNLRSNGMSSWQARRERPPSSPHLSVSSMCATYWAAWGTAEDVRGDSQQPPQNHYPPRQERQTATMPGHNLDGQVSGWLFWWKKGVYYMFTSSFCHISYYFKS